MLPVLMKITSIELKHTQPSLGPHETITIVSLDVSGRHKDTVANFLNTATLNNTGSLSDYLEAATSKNKERVDEFLKHAPDRELSSGGKISHLTFYFEDGETLSLHDVYRRFALSHFYPDFTSYMVENGRIDRHQPFEGGMPRPMELKKPKPPE